MEESIDNQDFNKEKPSVQPDVEWVAESIQKIKNELSKVIVGQEKIIDLILAGVFTGGHVLLEGVPGIAKTLLARCISKTLGLDFSRIQFTPDLMPTDIIGTSIFNMQSSEFQFKKGPVFSNIILIDEINRAPAKTQAALFEVMEEKQVTYDGTTYPMSLPFFVMATQNPIEQEGTYKLPEAQLDRFLFKLILEYPSLEEEIKILNRFEKDFKGNVINEVEAVFHKEDFEKILQQIENVYIKDDLIRYIAEIVDLTRNSNDLYLGASPRASLAMLKTSKAMAVIKGRNYLVPDDIQEVAFPVLNHRIILSPEREMEGMESKEIINEIIKSIEVPR